MLALVVAVGILVVRGPAGQVHAASPVAAGTEDLFEEEDEADNRLSELDSDPEGDGQEEGGDEAQEGLEDSSAKLGSLSPEARALFEENENLEGDGLGEPAEQAVVEQEKTPLAQPETQPGDPEEESLQEPESQLAESTEPTEQEGAVDPEAVDSEIAEEGALAQKPAVEELAAPQAQPRPGDRDGDGVPDGSDKCVDEPEDKDGFESLDGCPDPDNDNDGVLDAQDRCPFEKENLNGYADADGCPDEKPESQPEAVRAEAVEEVAAPVKVEPVPAPEGRTWSVYFGHMRWALDKAAKRAARRSVRSAKRAKAVYIRGQSDAGGRAAVNRWYANKRAKAVRRYLVAKGVPMSRITIMDAVIIDTDKVRRSKSNRRVDVIVVK